MLHAARSSHVSLVLALTFALSLVLVGLLVTPARAANIPVTTADDEYDTGAACSLREAVVAANTDAAFGGCPAGSGADVISLPAGEYTIEITGANEDAAAEGDFDLVGDVSVVGAGSTTTFVQHVFTKGMDRIFHVVDGTATLSALTVRDGGVEIGGGILTDPLTSLVMTNSEVAGNVALAGGGIYLEDGSSASLTGTTVAANSALFEGGGIYIDDGSSLTLSGSIVSENVANQGGGIYNDGGTLTSTGSTISGNDAIEQEGKSLSVEGGGIWNDGTVDLSTTTVTGNTSTGLGGGLHSADLFLQSGQDVVVLGIPSAPYALNIVASTISGNTAVDDGGGIHTDGGFTILNSTVGGNSAGSEGGGIRLFGDATIDYATIASNTASEGAGIWVVGDLELFATIVANSTGGDCLNADANLDSLGSNLDSDDSCELDPALNDHPGTNPMLGALAANGGPTATHALLAGSPAIDAVVAAGGETCISADQRGVSRPQDGDNNGSSAYDIGAFELAGAAPTGSATPSPAASQLPNTTAGGGAADPGLLVGSVVLLLLALPALVRRVATIQRRR